MKNLNFKTGLLVILLAVMNLFSIKSSACQASFTWAQTANNVISLNNTSTGTDTCNAFYWDMGDGNHEYGQTPSHTYNAPGIYIVCLTLVSGNNSCTSSCSNSWCDTITVTGVVLCNITLSTWVDSLASCATCADGSANSYCTGGTTPYIYLWSNGTTTANVSNLLPGTYTCCVTDANNCTACSSVILDSCDVHADYTWLQTSINTLSFTDASINTNNYTSYYWNFGDGNYSYSQNPIHYYSNTGVYNVCETIYHGNSNSSNSCSSSICYNVTVGGVNCNNFTLTIATTDASCYTCSDGSAIATVSGGTSPYTYSWSPSGGTLAIANNLIVGNYYCTANDSNGCTATSVGYVGPDQCSAYFTLYPDTNTAHLYWAINYATGAQPIHYHWTWGDNMWNTGDTAAYPSHQYTNAGVYTICLMITDANGCSTSYCVTDSILRTKNTMVQVNVISPNSSTGINETKSNTSLTIFPNPASQTLNITYNSISQLTITDVIGNKIYSQPITSINNSIDVSKWSRGVYFLQIKNEQESLVRKIIIQ